jgi:ribonuclease BN (tRNA processing enzyme)
MQLLNLRGGEGDFTTVYPEASGSGRALAGFLSNFDSRSTGKVRWNPMGAGDTLAIEPERHFLRTFATDHYVHVDPPRALSLGYQIVRHVDKVKPELRGLPQAELDALRLAHGKEYLTETLEDILLTITGDTMPMDPNTFRGSRVLLHECTFLDLDERKEMSDRGHPHCCLDEVLDIATCSGVPRLGLYHISRRYDDDFFLSRVRERCAKRKLDCAVSVALPGRMYEDLFAHCVWQGTGGGK